MKTTIEKQVVLDGSYGISKPRPKGIQNHVIEVWHVMEDGRTTSTHATREEARKMKTLKSETEIRMGGRYSIRKLGQSAYTTTNSVLAAEKLQKEANNVAGEGHEIIDNRNL